MKYIKANLYRFYKEEKNVFLLVILCSFITSIVIFFSYGIGYHFNTQRSIGETSSYEMKIQYKKLSEAKSERNNGYKEIADNLNYLTFSELKELLSELDSDIYINCNSIYTNLIYDDNYTSVTFPEEGGMITDNISIVDLRFLYDKGTELFTIPKRIEQLYNPYSYNYSLVDGNGFTNNDYINKKSKAVVGVGVFNDLYIDEKNKTEFGYDISYDGEFLDIDHPLIDIGDTQYAISGLCIDNSISIPISSLSDNARIKTFFPDLLTFCYDLPVTHEQYTRAMNLINEKYSELLIVKELDFEKKDTPFFSLMLIITAFLALIATLNVAIMMCYILMKRKKQISVFKLCGCSNLFIIRNFILETLIINVPSFLLGSIFFHTCIKPNITQYFIYLNNAYSLKTNIILFASYFSLSFITLFIMAYKTIKGFSSTKLKEEV